MPPRKRKQAATLASNVGNGKAATAKTKSKKGVTRDTAVAPPANITVKDEIADEEEEEEVNWNSLTVAELRKTCQEKLLDSKGTKAQLIKRLEEQDNNSDDEEPPAKLKKAFENLKKEKSKKTPKVDVQCSVKITGQVHEEYDCMLNQTNIGQNNNKFYIIQLIGTEKKPVKYYTWTRWGRVGDDGQSSLKGPCKLEAAEKDFRKKFWDKTKNDWDDRDNFVSHSGKYTLIEVVDDDDDEDESDKDVVASACQPSTSRDMKLEGILSCSLDAQTQHLISLIFDADTFSNAMKNMELDINKMPLGKLSKPQIARGFEALVAIEDAISEGASHTQLQTLTSRFFTLIPHSFGRQRPPVLTSSYTVQQKKDMLIVLSDIELTLSMQKKQVKDEKISELKPHPHDVNYKLLRCNLSSLKSSDKEYKVIETYFSQTRADWNKLELKSVWKVDRENEEERCKENDSIVQRKLLWHGTNVAVVAAILKDGLRIMPHSGGRVGKGIYFASENSKSAGYVQYANSGEGIMFLNEVALGKENHITRDDTRLTTPPKGFDSVVARGQTEPDPKKDVKLALDKHEVVVPVGKPVNIPKFLTSSFGQSEYLVYKESQARIRYLLLIKQP